MLYMFMKDENFLLNSIYYSDRESNKQNTVNSEIFARILFSRIVLKDIFAKLKIRDQGMIYIYQ